VPFECVDILLVKVLLVEGIYLFFDEEHFDELGHLVLNLVEEGENRVDVLFEKVKMRVVAHLVVACVAFELFMLRGMHHDALSEHLDGFKSPEVVAVFVL
jgi:hypothetical protein